MAISYRTPGVYIEEKPSLAKPIQGVGTSTAAFAGVAPWKDAHVGEPFAVTNWSQFQREFIEDDGVPQGSSTHLSDAVRAFFQNGGQLVHVLNTGDPNRTSVNSDDLSPLRPLDAQIVAAPGHYDPATHTALLEHCEIEKTRFAILDGPPTDVDLHALTVVGQAGGAPSTAGSESDAPDDGEGDDSDSEPTSARSPRRGGQPQGYKPRDSKYGAFYYPWPQVLDDGGLRPIPPSGAVAGVYARTDAERGVHHAPANAVVRGAVNLVRPITDAEQQDLNFNGVNCIRYFPDRGILVWGARTVSSDPEWRYVPVRRTMIFLEQSIKRSTMYAVFQPNNWPLWTTLRLSVENFLTRVWRDGALFGATPDEAFFVQCDEETNPPDVREAGMVVVRIGVALLRPAEFVVFEVSQYQAMADREQQGATSG